MSDEKEATILTITTADAINGLSHEDLKGVAAELLSAYTANVAYLHTVTADRDQARAALEEAKGTIEKLQAENATLAKVKDPAAPAHKPRRGPKLRIADTAAAVADVIDGDTTVVFSEGDALLERLGRFAVSAGEIKVEAGRHILRKAIALPGDVPRCDLTHAWLLGEDGKPVARCEIPGGLVTGGGRSAELPAGHLVF